MSNRLQTGFATRCVAGVSRSETVIDTIISGGQTGADRAALDFGLANGFRVGGWIPRDRLAEDGTISGRYPGLAETETVRPFRVAKGATVWRHRPQAGVQARDPQRVEQAAEGFGLRLSSPAEKPCVFGKPRRWTAMGVADQVGGRRHAPIVSRSVRRDVASGS